MKKVLLSVVLIISLLIGTAYAERIAIEQEQIKAVCEAISSKNIEVAYDAERDVINISYILTGISHTNWLLTSIDNLAPLIETFRTNSVDVTEAIQEKLSELLSEPTNILFCYYCEDRSPVYVCFNGINLTDMIGIR